MVLPRGFQDLLSLSDTDPFVMRHELRGIAENQLVIGRKLVQLRWQCSIQTKVGAKDRSTSALWSFKDLVFPRGVLEIASAMAWNYEWPEHLPYKRLYRAATQVSGLAVATKRAFFAGRGEIFPCHFLIDVTH